MGVDVKSDCDRRERGGCFCNVRLMSGCPQLELFCSINSIDTFAHLSQRYKTN